MTIKHYIHDAETGETVEIELTAEEISAREAKQAQYETDRAKDEQEKTAARAALLKRLGITADEAALLLS